MRRGRCRGPGSAGDRTCCPVARRSQRRADPSVPEVRRNRPDEEKATDETSHRAWMSGIVCAHLTVRVSHNLTDLRPAHAGGGGLGPCPCRGSGRNDTPIGGAGGEDRAVVRPAGHGDAGVVVRGLRSAGGRSRRWGAARRVARAGRGAPCLGRRSTGGCWRRRRGRRDRSSRPGAAVGGRRRVGAGWGAAGVEGEGRTRIASPDGW